MIHFLKEKTMTTMAKELSNRGTITTDQALRQHLIYLLNGDGAHLDFDAAVKDIPANLRGKRPDGGAHSPWELLEHLRIAQWDILEYIKSPKHASPDFPSGYWPKNPSPLNEESWDKSAEAFRRDFQAVVNLVSDGNIDLLAPLHGVADQTILRKLTMLADHNSYHLGQLMLVRRMLGAWQ
jgi:DinB superfamily